MGIVVYVRHVCCLACERYFTGDEAHCSKCEDFSFDGFKPAKVRKGNKNGVEVEGTD